MIWRRYNMNWTFVLLPVVLHCSRLFDCFVLNNGIKSPHFAVNGFSVVVPFSNFVIRKATRYSRDECDNMERCSCCWSRLIMHQEKNKHQCFALKKHSSYLLSLSSCLRLYSSSNLEEHPMLSDDERADTVNYDNVDESLCKYWKEINFSTRKDSYPAILDKSTTNQKRVSSSRRFFFHQCILAPAVTAGVASVYHTSAAWGVMTDETDTFATNWWTSKPNGSTQSNGASNTQQQQEQQDQYQAVPSDEISIVVSASELLRQPQRGLGLELSDVEFRTNLRVFVKSVQSDSYAAQLGIQPNWIVIGINDRSMERTNAQGVAMYLRQAVLEAKSAGTSLTSTTSTSSTNDQTDSIVLRFRDPTVFRDKLRSLSADGTSSQSSSVTTQVSPAGDTTIYNRDGTMVVRKSYQDTDQRITVTQLVPPIKRCDATGGADVNDLLEISYVGTVVETGQMFDGSAVQINGSGIPGRGNDVTLYFVLGKQPYGQFPPGWDVGLYGSCVTERRRIIVPPALAYGAAGVPRRNIPPNATLQYDVTVVSINGLSI